MPTPPPPAALRSPASPSRNAPCHSERPRTTLALFEAYLSEACPERSRRESRPPASASSSPLHLLAALHRPRQRHVVRVLQVAADGQAAGPPRPLQAQRPQQTRQVHRRRLAFQVGVRGQDHLRHLIRTQTRQQLLYLQVFRPDPVHRRDNTLYHVGT